MNQTIPEPRPTRTGCRHYSRLTIACRHPALFARLNRELLMDWISVEDRMPEPETECLVCGPSPWAGKPYVRIDTWAMQREAPLSFSSATVEIGLGWDESEYEDITHWMPLPAPPVTTSKQDLLAIGREAITAFERRLK